MFGGFLLFKLLIALVVLGGGFYRLNRSLKQGLEKPANIAELERRNAAAEDRDALREHRRRMGLE